MYCDLLLLYANYRNKKEVVPQKPPKLAPRENVVPDLI